MALQASKQPCDQNVQQQQRRTLGQGNDSKYVAHDIIMKHCVTMALKAALELSIPDILFKAAEGKPLTAEEIVAQLPIKSREQVSSSIRKLACTLKPLVWEGLFTESLNDKKQPVYGLTEVSYWFVKENKLNMLPVADLALRDEIWWSFRHISNSILDDAIIPFEEQNGLAAYEYANKHPEFGRAFQASMVSFSNMELASVMDSLQRYTVLEGVETLVDVGGGTGSNVAEIIAKNPHIRGINFDLPNVVAKAPVVKGMTSIAGNMFESVPSGDAMFVKWIIHNYDDKDAIVILKNCCNALPKHGKVIIVEYVLNDNDGSPKTKMGAQMDLDMLMILKGGRERTKVQYEEIIAAAGFSRSEFIQHPQSMDLIVAFKE